jgi:hypothetical protein
MYSLEAELEALHAAGDLDEVHACRMIAFERRAIFSLYEEIRATL